MNDRYAYPWWKEKVILSDQKRRDGLCPLTPEETALVLRALGYEKDTQIYIAAGEIYGSDRRMAALYDAFPNVVSPPTMIDLAFGGEALFVFHENKIAFCYIVIH